MSLAALQRDFRAWLTDQPCDMQAWTGAGGAGGLAVYHNAYRVTLVDCLRDSFGKTLAWLGEDAFVDAARAHIIAHPPSSWSLGHYGEGFDATLATLYPDDRDVAELAWLEWTLERVFEGPDAQPLTPEALGGIDWDCARLHVVPHRLGAATCNAGAIWSALAAGESPPAAQALPDAGAMLVWRQDFTPCFRTIERDEQDALAAIASGATFGMLCALMIDRLGEAEGVAGAGAMLGQWLRDGMIAAVESD